MQYIPVLVSFKLILVNNYQFIVCVSVYNFFKNLTLKKVLLLLLCIIFVLPLYCCLIFFITFLQQLFLFYSAYGFVETVFNLNHVLKWMWWGLEINNSFVLNFFSNNDVTILPKSEDFPIREKLPDLSQKLGEKKSVKKLLYDFAGDEKIKKMAGKKLP